MNDKTKSGHDRKRPAREEEGRPRIWNDVESLEAKIEEYFDSGCIVETGNGRRKAPMITGLAYYLGYADRQSIYDAINRNDEFSCVIKKAKLRVEMSYELMLRSGKPVGAIFALKNMGWADKIEHTGADGGAFVFEIVNREGG